MGCSGSNTNSRHKQRPFHRQRLAVHIARDEYEWECWLYLVEKRLQCILIGGRIRWRARAVLKVVDGRDRCSRGRWWGEGNGQRRGGCARA